MSAFLTNPPTLPLQSRPSTSLCPRRSLPLRHRTCVTFSAVTDEFRPVEKSQQANDFSPPIRATPPHTDPSSLRKGPVRPIRPARRDQRHDRFTPPPPFVPDPTAAYYTRCGNCQAAYELDPADLATGKKVACVVCSNEWFQRPDRLIVLKDTEAFKAYPMEEKEQLMTAARNVRRERQQYPRRDSRDRRPPRRSQFSIFIGNLPFSATESELAELVNNTVKTSRVSIIKDPTSGNSRGFAFADVSSDEEVQIAVDRLDGVEFGGRNIAVRAGKKNT